MSRGRELFKEAIGLPAEVPPEAPFGETGPYEEFHQEGCIYQAGRGWTCAPGCIVLEWRLEPYKPSGRQFFCPEPRRRYGQW